LIYEDKVSEKKGYKVVSLAASNVGSQKTVQKPLQPATTAVAPTTYQEPISTQVKNLVQYIYEEATNLLTSKIQAKITTRGLETPLGILTLEQIDKGQAVLNQLCDLYQEALVSHRL
jgi:hypothetical protein